MASKFFVGLELECDMEDCLDTSTIIRLSRQDCIDEAIEEGWHIGKKVRCPDHAQKEDRKP